MIFGIFGWYMAVIAIPFFPLENAPNNWIEACALGSVIIGWRVCGPRAGRGYVQAIGVGLTTSAVIGVVALFGLAFNQMVINSMRLRYNGVMEGLVDVFQLMLEFSEYFYDIPLLLTLAIGGIISAWVTEHFAQRYP